MNSLNTRKRGVLKERLKALVHMLKTIEIPVIDCDLAALSSDLAPVPALQETSEVAE
jgi:hypothetical protein